VAPSNKEDAIESIRGRAKKGGSDANSGPGKQKGGVGLPGRDRELRGEEIKAATALFKGGKMEAEGGGPGKGLAWLYRRRRWAIARGAGLGEVARRRAEGSLEKSGGCEPGDVVTRADGVL